MDGMRQLEELYNKSQQILSGFEHLPEKDTRRVYFNVIGGQLAVSLTNLRINQRFSETNKQEFEGMFNNDKAMIENYIHNMVQNTAEAVMDAALFQTELVFRYYYSKITGDTPGKEKHLHKIVAELYEDTENNWAKEEARLIILLWTLRNTIHTGGIYFVKEEGLSLTYKGNEYKFEFGKAPAFLADGYSMTMVSNLLDSMKVLFESDKIKNVGSFDHPNYAALGY